MNRAERRRREKLARTVPAGALLQEAARHHRAGALNDAETCYRAFLGRMPGHPQALHLLGLVCHQTGRNAEAATLIAEAERRAPDDAEMPYNLGNCLMLDGRPAEAADAFRRALGIRPKRGDALNNLGTALQRLDRLDEAIGAYQEALEAEPERTDALGNMAQALQAQIARLGLDAHVVLHGRVGDVAMVEAIQRSRVSVSVPVPAFAVGRFTVGSPFTFTVTWQRAVSFFEL